MENVQTHVREHGDTPFSQRPFDVLDSLALTQLVYMPMEGFLDSGETAGLKALWTFVSLQNLDPFPTFYQRKCYEFLQCCAATPRYDELTLFDYQNHIDPDQETQFCACTFALPDGTRYIAFRGHRFKHDRLEGRLQHVVHDRARAAGSRALCGRGGREVSRGSCFWAATPRAATSRCTRPATYRKPCARASSRCTVSTAPA